MKRMVVVSLFSLNLITAMAYAQPSPQNSVNHRDTTQTVTSVTAPEQNQVVNQNALLPLQPSTVAMAKTLKDDTQVRLQGQVIRALGKDKYEFRDATGTLIVEIDNQKWHGKPITQQAQVILIGEIDRESDNQVELDVDEVRTVSAQQ
ncbi:YgiW/YdeI family stress tolerance OB fold protein [Alkanindiges illinoisensis]|uniref:YgiW/YdeI family stress tolerance OB fold protein n=1 Tax=Alkanindiges illinoisensis TaxID=197183 RepID=UPI0006858EFF|nr:NirD/YgiW/YdeI family stress tolerance protein [Alkanindiges illinoisensis]